MQEPGPGEVGLSASRMPPRLLCQVVLCQAPGRFLLCHMRASGTLFWYQKTSRRTVFWISLSCLFPRGTSRNVGSEILPYLKVCQGVRDVGRRPETPGSVTEDFITPGRATSASLLSLLASLASAPPGQCREGQVMHAVGQVCPCRGTISLGNRNLFCGTVSMPALPQREISLPPKVFPLHP